MYLLILCCYQEVTVKENKKALSLKSQVAIYTLEKYLQLFLLFVSSLFITECLTRWSSTDRTANSTRYWIYNWTQSGWVYYKPYPGNAFMRHPLISKERGHVCPFSVALWVSVSLKDWLVSRKQQMQVDRNFSLAFHFK